MTAPPLTITPDTARALLAELSATDKALRATPEMNAYQKATSAQYKATRAYNDAERRLQTANERKIATRERLEARPEYAAFNRIAALLKTATGEQWLEDAVPALRQIADQ